jgi:hypothetical protein
VPRATVLYRVAWSRGTRCYHLLSLETARQPGLSAKRLKQYQDGRIRKSPSLHVDKADIYVHVRRINKFGIRPSGWKVMAGHKLGTNLHGSIM